MLNIANNVKTNVEFAYTDCNQNSSFKGVGVSNSANSDFNIEENDSKLINPNEAQSVSLYIYK